MFWSPKQPLQSSQQKSIVNDREIEKASQVQKYIDRLNLPLVEGDDSQYKRYSVIPKYLLNQEVLELAIKKGVCARQIDEDICIKYDLYNFAVNFYPPNVLLIPEKYVTDRMVDLYFDYEVRNEKPIDYIHLLPKDQQRRIEQKK